jgi:hypothetical protein
MLLESPARSGPPRSVIWLSGMMALLALVASAIGLFWQPGASPVSFTTVHGQTVQLFGSGIYHYDTLFTGAAHRGTDAATMFVGVPLLVVALVLARRGSLRGRLMLIAALAYFLYDSASVALGGAYNSIFPVYIALFSASLFAFVRCFMSVDLRPLAARLSTRPPRFGPAAVLLASGVPTLGIWLSELVGPLIAGQPPRLLGSYTTMVTYVLDLGVITPALLLAGVLVLRRAPMGYLLSFALLGIIVVLGPAIAAQTVSQLSAGISFTVAEVVGPIAGFGALALLAIWVLAVLLLGLEPEGAVDPPTRPGSRAQPVRQRSRSGA